MQLAPKPNLDLSVILPPARPPYLTSRHDIPKNTKLSANTPPLRFASDNSHIHNGAAGHIH